MQKKIEWSQDSKTVKLILPIKGTTLKKIDIFLSDLVLKINVKEKNLVKIFDFKHEIDFSNIENKFVYKNENLECTLIKQQAELSWETLLVNDLSKEDILERRKKSIDTKFEYEQKFSKNLEDIKIKYDRFSTQEMMRIEDIERKVLHDKKVEEKKQAEAKIYENLDDFGKFKNDQKENFDEFEEIEEIEEKNNKNIFNDDDFITNQKEKEKEKVIVLPEIRQPKSAQVHFTEKIYPHMAAREQHFREAPVPKLKHALAKDSKDEKELKNPLWLKDKGDEFFLNKDFYSALNAYSSSFKLIS